MRILRLRLLSTGEYRIVVHLDTARVTPEGEPLGLYTTQLTWPPKPDGMTHASYLQQERPRIRQVCQGVLAHLDATEGPAMPGEGDPL